MNKLMDEKKHQDALAFVVRHRGVLQNAQARELEIVIYDAWAMSYQPKDWKAAISVYKKGLEQYPGDSHLENNLKYCEQESKK